VKIKTVQICEGSNFGEKTKARNRGHLFDVLAWGEERLKGVGAMRQDKFGPGTK